jgi:hypothetical protein
MGRSNVDKRLNPRHLGRACGIQAHSQDEPEWRALGKFASSLRSNKQSGACGIGNAVASQLLIVASLLKLSACRAIELLNQNNRATIAEQRATLDSRLVVQISRHCRLIPLRSHHHTVDSTADSKHRNVISRLDITSLRRDGQRHRQRNGTRIT